MKYLKKFESNNDELDFETFKDIFLDIIDESNCELDKVDNHFSLRIYVNLIAVLDFDNDFYEYGFNTNQVNSIIKNRLDELNNIKKIIINHEKISKILSDISEYVEPRLKSFFNFKDIRFVITNRVLYITVEIEK
jgi:hypothetical protein